MLLKIYKNNKKEKVEESESEKRKDRKKQFESKVKIINVGRKEIPKKE